jgi:leader peptidase (prepilin peptidase)/N-methyltransferase
LPGIFVLAAGRSRALNFRMLLDLSHPLWTAVAFVFGACVGSFLNVVIYRVPLGLSVNNPKRSFCPRCRHAIPMWQNIPLVSWLLLRGKCANCGGPIARRYFGVELLTAVLFAAVWAIFPPLATPFLFLCMALLVAISFIDAEHLIIPTVLTWIGTAAGVIGAFVWPRLSALADPLAADTWQAGLLRSGIGWAAGFFGLWAVVLGGKALFGRKILRFPAPVAWELREGGEDDELKFVIDGDEHLWGDLFFRKTDELILEGGHTCVDNGAARAGSLVIRAATIELEGETLAIEALKNLSGTATRVVVPREAMGMGDIYLLGMLGALFGWPAVAFALFAGCVFAIIAALVGRVGLGVHLPFGPFLALGGAGWAFGGWRLWQWYLEVLTGAAR